MVKRIDNVRLPALDKRETSLPSTQAHARALELACRGAAQILASRSIEPATQPKEPLPESSVRLLRCLPRAHD
jgi:hypothetical protein